MTAMARLRSATAPGEDRNDGRGPWVALRVGLRSATAPGEDRNAVVPSGPVDVGRVLRSATAPGEDRNAVTRGNQAALTYWLRSATAPGEDRNTRAGIPAPRPP